MHSTDPAAYVIRSFRRGDRRAVRDICVKCSWLGDYRPDRIMDDWIWAEYWTRYFTDREPRHTWIVERRADGAAVGYLTGTADASRVERYAPFLFPGIVRRAIRRRLVRRRESRRAVLAMLRSLVRGELSLPAGVKRRFPATFHLNLLPEARGMGMGSGLFDVFIERMAPLGVPGVHAQPMSINPAMPKFLAGRGFRMIGSHPLTAFAFADPQPIDLQTWVRVL